MSTNPLGQLDPGLVTLLTGAVTAVCGFAAARISKDTKVIEKAPDVQEQINKAVAGLIMHYTNALEQEKASHSDHVQDLEDRLGRSEARIEQLITAMKSAGITIPAIKQ